MDLTNAKWRKSTHSGPNGGECVELADVAGVVAVRDSKDPGGAPSSLSTGQRQRLSLAMALLRPSRLLLLDEPERGLDAAFRERFAGLLAGYAADGGAVVMATHDLRFAEGARHVTLGAAA